MLKFSRKPCLIIVLALIISSATFAQTHPFSVHDMLAMDRISDPQISPAGDQIVFVLRKTDLENNKGVTDLWLVNADGTGLKPLTTHEASDVNPRWHPQGKSVYFISTRSGSAQIWEIPLDGGEAAPVTDLALEVGNLVLSPNGESMAFTMEVFVGMTPEETSKKLKEIENQKASGRMYDRLFIRHWDSWKDGRRSHLFVMPTSGKGEPLDVMKDMDADTPSKPWGGPEEITFTPEGNGLIFSARNAGRAEAWSTNFDLFYVPIDGSKKPRCLTEKNKAWDTYPIFSPDKKTLSYLAMQRPDYESDRLRIILRDWQSGKERILTENWDRSISSYCFSTEGKRIYATATNLGQESLFAIDVETGGVNPLVHEGSIGAIGEANGRIFYTMNNFKSPNEIYSAASDGKAIRTITQINKDKLDSARMGEYEQFTFKGWNDEDVYCYVVKPIDFDSSKKYPVAFLIHGGPQGSFGNMFHYRWNPQAYSGAEYGAVMVDFHGSTGYGQDFCDSIRGDWGGKPFVDLQKGLAAALERYPWMDRKRVGALGASFGGYMINWIAGNWPDRFRCLVNHDGNLDERMAYFDTEELWFPEWDHLGTPWKNPDQFEKHNPINYVKNWRTPMLVIHGAHDFRVVDTQGISTFTALQRKGIPSKLLYFPDESHWVQKPHNSILWHKTVIEWLDEWVK